MEFEKIKNDLDKISLPVYVQFVAENNGRTCIACQRWHGKIFDKDDPLRPQLPLHPNCRCRYQDIPINGNSTILQAEKQNIASTLVGRYSITAEQADSLAKQIVVAKMEKKELASEKLFLLFNGRYLLSSDGQLMLNAVSGKPISEVYSEWSKMDMLSTQQTVTRKFNYSYQRQGIANTGGVPEGLYYILCSEMRSIMTSPVSHFFGQRGWGSYSWSMHPCKNTNMRERGNFFIHGGSESSSAGCIDLREHDVTLYSFLHRASKNKLYVYVNYFEENIAVSEKNMIFPVLYPMTY